ncbi:MAG: 3-deoxy-D-manno-octulosonic acid transferase [Rufibacter sp.]
MSKFLYEAGVRAYGLAVQMAAPFNTKAAKWVNGRRGLFEELEKAFKKNTSPVAWFHCASLGEFEQGRPLMEGFRQKYPQYKILLTFFSPSGYEVRKNYPGADFIFYLPLDSAKNARKLLFIVKPKLAFFVKYEFWHHYTRALKKRHIPFFSISAIFRPNQIYFRKRGSFYRRILGRFTHIFTQNQESAALLSSLNFGQVSMAGDTRIDRVLQTAKTAAPIPVATAFKGVENVMVVGSSWPQDMQVLLPFMQAKVATLKFIMAPHEIKDTELRKLEEEFPGQAIRYSKATPEAAATARILLIDNIGMLSALYQYADYAYVGGAFGKGLHNILEPAVFGPPIFIGPRYEKFQEAVDLVAAGVAYPVKNPKEMTAAFEKLPPQSQAKEEVKKAAAAYIKSQAGATQRILTTLEYWLPSPTA